MGKKWLTETEAYNIITQCDVVRDTLANSPGDGIYQRFRHFRSNCTIVSILLTYARIRIYTNNR